MIDWRFELRVIALAVLPLLYVLAFLRLEYAAQIVGERTKSHGRRDIFFNERDTRIGRTEFAFV